MEREKIINRKELIIYLLEELNKKQKPVRLDEFFIEIGYAKGLESFREILTEMSKNGWINTLEEQGGLALGILPTISYKYSISVRGIEYLENLKPKSKEQLLIKFIKDHLKEILIGIFVTVIGGLLLHFIINGSFNFSQSRSSKVTNPYLKIENYKIPPKNEELYSIDNLELTAEYQGAKFSLEPEVQLIDFKIIDDYYIFEKIKPTLEVIETSLDQPNINEINKKGTYDIQLRRKIIFDGLKIFDFKNTDKLHIGNVRFLVKYKIENSKYSDTILSKIFIEK